MHVRCVARASVLSFLLLSLFLPSHRRVEACAPGITAEFLARVVPMWVSRRLGLGDKVIVPEEGIWLGVPAPEQTEDLGGGAAAPKA